MNNEPAKSGELESGKEPELGLPANANAAGRVHPAKKRRALPSETSRMTGIFWVLVTAMLGYVAITWLNRPTAYSLAAILVAFFALLPAYFWCSGKALGLPIFPFFAGTYALTYAMQLVLADPSLREHATDSIWRAALTVSAFLLVATLVWHYWVTRPRLLPPTCLILSADRGTDFLLLVLFAGVIETVVDHAGWLTGLPGGVFTAIRQFVRGPTAFAVFVLAMRWGGRTLNSGQTSLFIGLFISFCIADASGLFLYAVVIMSLMLVLGFVISRKNVPLVWLIPMVVTIGLLHIGKAEMRSRYWAEGVQGNSLKPLSYPAFYAEWFECSVEQFLYQKKGGDEAQSILSRVNTINLLLQAQEMAPKEVPFLEGETYAIIPSALVPRLFNSEKASPHYSTSLLNVTFGNQTWETAASTSIGWGLLNESYANFGFAGCLALALILGTFYGLLTHWSIGLPLTSLAALVGIFTLSFAIQTEMTAAIYITAYLQGLFALLLVAYSFTDRILLLPAGKPGFKREIKPNRFSRRSRRSQARVTKATTADD